MRTIALLTYLLVHLGVVQHGNELLHEGLVRHLLVERGLTLVHQDVEQTKCEVDHSKLRHLESSKELIGHDLGAVDHKIAGLDWSQTDGLHLLVLACVDLLDYFVDDLDGWALVIHASRLLH